MEFRTLQKIIDFDNSKNAALCTQIEWRGSVPRKDYPIMLVDSNRHIIGTIGGGALEHSVVELAQKVIQSGKSLVKEFELSNQDVTQSGSICGGATRVLIEPFSNEIRSIFKSIIGDKIRINNILVTSISWDDELKIDRKRITKDFHLTFPQPVVKVIDDVTTQKKSRSITLKDATYLIQNIGYQPTLHIFGAGHVGQAVASMAHFIELNTQIYDERKDLATKDRFPFALQINCSEISDLIDELEITLNDYVLVATRGHQHDFELMQWLLKLEINYIGLVSSNKKWQLLSEALIKDGFSKDKLEKVHSPVGLDIGSETVPEIAVSIISEIINHYRKGKKSTISLSTL